MPATPRRRLRADAPQNAPIHITLVSDATGSLGQHVLQTILTQFPPGAFRLETINFVNSEEQLVACLARLQRAAGLVVHATIYEAYKRRIEATCRRHGLPAYDLTGPIVAFLVKASGRQPQVSYGKLHELSTDYFDRITAIEYAIEHDDGGGLDTLGQADVILTGVSRTTKTPTSMVLATHGYRAANVPLVPGMDPPQALLEAEVRRVICLTASEEQLATFRERRMQEQFGGVAPGYTDAANIREELRRAMQTSRARGWRVLNVTEQAVEETAARVIELIHKQA